MHTFNISKRFEPNVNLNKINTSIMRCFGLDKTALAEHSINHKLDISLSAGDICYITGPSGCGKSVLLNAIFEQIEAGDKVRLADIEAENNVSCAEAIGGDFLAVMDILAKAGISDVFSILNTPARLSDGQRYRYRLAKAISSNAKFVFADGFCSNLDRITAAVISHNIRKFANRSKKIFVLASAHDDLLADLSADVIILKQLTGSTETIYKRQAQS